MFGRGRPRAARASPTTSGAPSVQSTPTRRRRRLRREARCTRRRCARRCPRAPGSRGSPRRRPRPRARSAAAPSRRRHLGAEAAIHLRELEPDVAAADDDEMRGHASSSRIEVLVRNGTSSMPGMSGTRARPPTLMKMRGAVSTLVADAHRVGRLEAGVAAEDRAAVHAAQPASRRRCARWPTTASARALTAAMSIATAAPSTTP